MKKDKKKNKDKKGEVKGKKKDALKKTALKQPTITDQALCAAFAKSVAHYNQCMEAPLVFEDGLSLYPAEAKALEAVLAGDHLNLTALAQALGVSKSAATKAVTKLLEKHLITKVVSPANKRAILLSLTPQGKAIAQALPLKRQARLSSLAQIVQTMDNQDRAAIAVFCDGVLAL